MKTSKQIEQELEEEKAKYKFLKDKKVSLEKELNQIEQELRSYQSTSWSSGRIKYKEAELEKVKLIEKSENLPHPIFNDGDVGDKYKIFKVTPKRIYLREINKERMTILEEFVNKDGSGWNLHNINIAETIKVWEEYLKNNKI
jgi:hypothetical protein